MKTFKDKDNRDWCIDIKLGSMRRIKSLTGVNLAEDLPKVMEELKDMLVFGAVLYACCKPQADDRNVSDDEFYDLFDEDVLVDATKAFLEDYTDFFQPAKRRAMKTTLRKAMQMSEASQANMPTDEELEAMVERTFGQPSTNSQQSSDLTQTT